MPGYETKRMATSEPHRSDFTAAKRTRSGLNSTTDHRFWGLNGQDSTRIARLYDQGRLLMAD
ncbi:hypothetical protein G6011_11038 [Alternaria panax]|uniref:Uncharacterized protein n=1 Tax=Alternaria panax TaxID=48097 RepID=A0AAD4ID26_9PLEO|nr:hypothetical protein G6011_11038 [Alternaria panax]